MANFQIDGVSVDAAEGTTILAAARDVGVHIPTLCDDPLLSPGGSCRVCMVELEGRPSPVAACTYPVTAGLEVVTDSTSLRTYRRGLLDLVLSELPTAGCPRCAERGPCELHELADTLGATGGRFSGARSGRSIDDGNPFIFRDYDRCIYCYRCARICNEVEQAHAIVPGGSGFQTRITTGFERGLLDANCTFCGQCIETCPTGALVDKTRSGRKGGLDKTVQTVCPYCGTGCTVLLDIADNHIVGARGDRSSPVSGGALCVKGRFGWDFVHSPDRLKTPLVRRNEGLEPVNWDEALGLVADRLTQITTESGPDAAVFWSSARASSEANYLFQKLARAVVGTNNVDNCART